MLEYLSQNWYLVAIAAVVCYLIGSVNMAIIITKMLLKKDIRTMGSGNAGFTNVLRSVGKAPAIMTIVFDFLKGIFSAFIAGLILSSVVAVDSPQIQEVSKYGSYLGGIFCMLGHIFPVYFKFKGGKGVVTAAALMAVTDFRVFVVVLMSFAIGFIVTRIISIGSLLAAVMYPVFTYIFLYNIDLKAPPEGFAPCTMEYVIVCTVLAAIISLLVIIMHKDNIKRIIKGEEKKIMPKEGKKKKKKDDEGTRIDVNKINK